MKEKLEKIWFRFLGYFPQKLPIGEAEFDGFCGKIFYTYGLPDFPSYRKAIATMVLHLPPTIHKKAPFFFARSVKKAQANEVAYQYLHPPREPIDIMNPEVKVEDHPPIA